jgi:hypothetical protein
VRYKEPTWHRRIENSRCRRRLLESKSLPSGSQAAQVRGGESSVGLHFEGETFGGAYGRLVPSRDRHGRSGCRAVEHHQSKETSRILLRPPVKSYGGSPKGFRSRASSTLDGMGAARCPDPDTGKHFARSPDRRQIVTSKQRRQHVYPQILQGDDRVRLVRLQEEGSKRRPDRRHWILQVGEFFYWLRIRISTRACSHYCKDLLLISRQDGDHRRAV